MHSIRLSKICTGDPLPLCRRRKYQQASKLDSEKKRLNFACYCLIFLTPDPNRYDTQGLFTPRLYARIVRTVPNRLNFNFLKRTTRKVCYHRRPKSRIRNPDSTSTACYLALYGFKTPKPNLKRVNLFIPPGSRGCKRFFRERLDSLAASPKLAFCLHGMQADFKYLSGGFAKPSTQ